MLIGQKQNNSNRTMYAIYKEINMMKLRIRCGLFPLDLDRCVSVSDRTSRLFRHLHNSTQCRILCSDKCFSILDHASTTFQLKIEEF